MNESFFEKQKPNQEQVFMVKLASVDDWQACKELRLMMCKGNDAKMFGITPENREEIIKEEEAESEKEWKEKLSGDGVFGVLAWSGSEPIGTGFAKRREDKEDWFIYSGYVRPGFRGGVGKKIFAARLFEIIKRGGKKVVLGVKAINATSIHVAESFCFKKVEENSSYEGFYMELKDVNDPEVVRKINGVLNA